MKRALSMILVLVMVLSMVPAVYAETAEPIIIASGTDVAVTATESVTHTWTAESDGILTVTMGATTPGYRYTLYDAAGNTVGLPKTSKLATSVDFELTGGTQYTFELIGFNTGTWIESASTLTYTLSFVASEEEGGGVEKAKYEVSETALALGDNTLTLLETAVTTIYVFEPTETAVYTFTAPEGTILGYWGAGSWFLQDPNSTTNTYEWTCTGVGQTAYIGVSGVTGSFNLNVAKTGDYTVVEVPIVKYENKATLETFTLPEGSVLGSYIDVTAETVHTAVLGEDGYYHLDSADGDVILVDMDYQDIVLSAALKSDRPVMYVWDHDENGNQVKYDIGDAVLAYEAVMDGNGYYPLTEDLIYFYDNYANGAAIYSFHVTGSYNEENVWMYCMRTVSFPETTDPEETEPEVTEPEVTEPEESEPEESEPEVTEPEFSEPEVSEPADPNALISVTNEAVTVNGYVFEYTAASAGTLHVSVGECSPGWRYKVFSPDGIESGYRSKYTAGTECDYKNVAGKWKIVFYAYSSIEASNVDGTVSFTVTFTADEASGGETEKNAYEVSDTELSLGSNTLTLLDTAVTTVFKFKTTEAGTYTFTAPEGAFVGNWGSNASYLTDPNSTSNTCEWNCSSAGQSAYIGVTGVDGSFVLNVTLNESTEPDVSEPEVTEPEVTEPEVSEPENPVIPDEDVPAGTYYSITIDGNTTFYSSSSGSALNQHLKSIAGTAYLKFYQNMVLGSSYTIDIYNGDIVLDLNGCTITSSFNGAGCLYVSGGKVTVIDSSDNGSGLLLNDSTGFGIEVYSGSVIMQGGTAQGVQGAKVWANASLDLQGGKVCGTNYGINALADSTVTISGGEIIQANTGSFKYAIYGASTATVTITGGHFNGTVSGTGLNGKISGGYFTTNINNAYIASDCELQNNDDAIYAYKVVNPNAEPEEPDVTEPTEPEASEPEVTEPSEPEVSEPEVTEPSEPETSEPEVTEPSEPAGSGVLIDVTNETVTATGYTFEYTAATAGTLNVTVGTCSPGWRYKTFSPDGSESIYRTKWNAGESCDYEGDAGNWKVVFYAYSSTEADNVAGTVSFSVSFTPKEGGDSGEVEKAEYEVSDTALVLGDNAISLLETAITTIYVFEPTETGVYTFTAPAGAILGYWGAGSWFLSDPNSTTNTYEWTCTGVGQSAYIGVSDIEGTFNLNVEKTGDYTVVEIPIVLYENKAPLSPFTLPEGAVLGSYIDVTTETKITVVLGEDGYYHLNSADGPIVLVDMDYQDIILSAALQSDRPVMYAYVTDEEGNQIKYDIGTAIKEYEAVMDENGYYPLTEDLILFYDTYAVGAGTYTFYVTGDYNEENVWLYCMRTVTFPVNPVDSWNLVLEDDLKVNFYMNMGENDSVQVSVGGSTYTFNAADLEVKDGKYVVTISIAAAQMTDDITVQIVGSDEVNTYTVRGYADTVLADQTLSNYHALIKEMLNYGAAAQTYFEYNTEKLANAGITDVAANDVPETTTEMVVNDQIGSLAFYGASVVYRDKIAVRFYFTGSIDGINFGEYTVNNKDDMYYVEVANILPQDLDQQITVTAIDAEGNTLTVTYGPMNYIVRMNAKGDENMQNLMKALYNYYLAAKALRAN